MLAPKSINLSFLLKKLNRYIGSDVTKAILDGVDGIVLSDETAVGDYPINAVSILAKCCVEAEACFVTL
jgi:pyruvate kinase